MIDPFTALEDLAIEAGLDPDDLRDYLWAEIQRRDPDWLPGSLSYAARGYESGTSLRPYEHASPRETAQL